MRFLRLLLVVALLTVAGGELWSAEAPAAGGAAHAAAAATGEAASGHEAGPAVTAAAPTVFNLGPLPVTNTMINTWIVALFILVVVRAGTRNLKEVPSGLQNLIEAAVDGLEQITSGLLEPKVARWAFPLVATYFLFILLCNLVDLLPGVGSLGWGAPGDGFFSVKHADVPLFRPPTADANLTVAMAAVFFIMSSFWALRFNGPWGLVKHIFGVKGGMTGWIVLPLSLVFIFIGMIEVISICIRPVALAMRLYGNIYGGESVLTIMLTKGPLGLAAVPFYFLELLVAIVQALVFTLLSIAFIGSMCSHTEDESHEAH
jgi:F-type H+-transporting ATPase subunit a